MYRILQCVVGMNRGGIETLLMSLLHNIDRDTVQFDFLTSAKGEFDEDIRQLGGRVYYLPFIDKVGPFSYNKSLRNFFTSHPEYRVIHVHMDKFGGCVLQQAARVGVPVRISHSHNTKNEGNFFIQAIKNYYGTKVISNSTHFFACGKAAAQWMYGQHLSEVVILHNGVDLASFTPRDTRNMNSFTIGHIGRFNKVKNQLFLLRIFQQVLTRDSSAKLIFVGDGPNRVIAEQWCVENNLSNAVSFLGIRKDISALLGSFDVLCMPSLHEGLPVVLVEAQATGIPCLVSQNVSAESNITGSVSFLSLSSSVEMWAQTLLAQKSLPRRDNRALLMQNGYSIHEEAQKLQELYCKYSSTI